MARVVLENVRVDFPIYATQRNLRTAIFNRATGGLIQRRGKKQDRVVVEALAGVSMTLEDGDRLGLIGHNGSGKSTLLKVIAGLYEPIEGRLMVEGAVTPLFDMMPGLDPEDSGYENILTAGLLLGLSREEIETKIPEIEEFSELGEYMALPVRTYSAGMMMRLGFALVTALDPGVLLMDEGIGAGDARFAERAQKRLNDFIGRSRIMVVASHSPALIESICNKAALMVAGEVLALGPVKEIFDRYDAMIHGAGAPESDMVESIAPEVESDTVESIESREAVSQNLETNETSGASQPLMSFGRIDLRDWTNRTGGASGARIEWAELRPSGEASDGEAIHIGLDIRLRFGIRLEETRQYQPIKLAVSLCTSDGEPIANMVDEDSQFRIDFAQAEESFSVVLSDVRFYPGTYLVSFWVGSPQSETWDWVHDCIAVKILSGGTRAKRPLPREAGLLFLTPSWGRLM
jgi:ABC-type polysaccharide/polyol phosphate transport system ATPase subunit